MIGSAEEFVRLRTSDIEEQYERAAHDEASIGVWQAVIGGYPDMAFWVAHNKTVPHEILQQLAGHKDWRVRSLVASKGKLQAPLLLKLASDANEIVRMDVAGHKKATLEVLSLLVDDSWSEVANRAQDRIKRGDHK